jgi:protein gp37
MAETSIEWTDFTVNFWWGCTEVGPGCDHCYAKTWDKRLGGEHWGVKAERRKIAGATAMLCKINRNAAKFHAEHGRWPNVFLHSMSDVFDNAVPPIWRFEALTEVEAATDIRAQIVTKRIGNVEGMVPTNWLKAWPKHVGLMITVVNQEEANRDIPKLLALKAKLGIPWVGLSMEPLLGPVDLTLDGLVCLPCPNSLGGLSMDPETGAYECCSRCDYTGIGDEWGIDWVIVGGESGPHARPMHPDWARSLRDQCAAAGVPFLFKQWGEWVSAMQLQGVTAVSSSPAKVGYFASPDRRRVFGGSLNGQCFEGLPDHHDIVRVGKRTAGRLLDGVTHEGFPRVAS